MIIHVCIQMPSDELKFRVSDVAIATDLANLLHYKLWHFVTTHVQEHHPYATVRVDFEAEGRIDFVAEDGTLLQPNAQRREVWNIVQDGKRLLPRWYRELKEELGYE